ncbi:MAG: phosphoribosyltransferase family protein [Patescibacteria group bacterium]
MKEIIKQKVLFFSGNGNHPLGLKIINCLGEFLGTDLNFQHINFAKFGDQEPDDKIPRYEQLAGKTVVLCQSTYTADLLEEFLQLSWAITRQYQAKSLIAVIPFLRFRRQDHWEKTEEINRLRMLIDRMAHAGVNDLIVVTPHSAGSLARNCQEYNIGFYPVDMSEIFARNIRPFLEAEKTLSSDQPEVVAYAPDEGSIRRALALAQIIGCGVTFNLKKRELNNSPAIVQAEKESIETLISQLKEKFAFDRLSYATAENIKDKVVLMVEDEIASGETANNTGRLLKSFGAKAIMFAATHAICVPGWQRRLFYDNPFDKIFIADSIPRNYENRTGGRMHDVTVSDPTAAILFQVLRQKMQ